MAKYDFTGSGNGKNGKKGEPTEPPVKNPRFWDNKAPSEKWDRQITIQIDTHMYDALVELSHSPQFETRGRMQPLLREAVEEFLLKYVEPGPKRSALEQMSAFRDLWAEDILAAEFMEQLSLIMQSFDRWRMAKEPVKILRQFRKLMDGLMLLSGDWRRFAIEQIRINPAVEGAMKFARDSFSLDEREELDKIHDLLYSGM